MSKQVKNIFSDSACPTRELMLKYSSNLLKGEEKHAFERHLAGCPFCSEAMEGISLMENDKEFTKDVFELNEKIDLISKDRKRPAYWPLAVAASVSILLLSGTWYFLKNDNQNPLANGSEGQKSKIRNENTIAIAPESVIKDSLTNHKPVTHGVLSEGTYSAPLKSNENFIEEKQTMPSPKEDKKLTEPQLSYSWDDVQEGERSDGFVNNQNKAPELRSSVPATAPSAASVAYNFKMDTAALWADKSHLRMNEMLAMVEQEFQPVSGNLKSSEKKKLGRQATSKSEAMKDQGLDDCPNCPKKTASEVAESDLAKISMEYAVKKYQAKEYELAHKQFEQIIKENKSPYETAKAGIYDALALVNLNKEGDALKVADKTISINDANTANAAKWIKASIYLTQKEDAKARDILRDLSNHPNFYQVKAGEILGTLK